MGGSGCQIDSRDIIRNLMPLGTPDRSGSIEKERVLLVQCVNWNTLPSTLEPAPFHDDQTKISIASWARIDNRDELAYELNTSMAEARSDLRLRAYPEMLP